MKSGQERRAKLAHLGGVGSIVTMRLWDASGRELNLDDYKIQHFVLEVVARENSKTTGTVISSALFSAVFVDTDTEAAKTQPTYALRFRLSRVRTARRQGW